MVSLLLAITQTSRVIAEVFFCLSLVCWDASMLNFLK